MAKVLIDIDQEALDKAAAVLGTTTPQDTVNAALRGVADTYRMLPEPQRAGRDVSPDTPHGGAPREGRER
ncbi:Arc/MetJ family transcription regulator [Nocardiopsis aegyptia]|uniref:Arc/MetJ family transcription regulator n=1 Tax=Nocardiopsis aegyptia TaxID=220378 RepID=A0A7Z0EK20_9ACTN|nr:Arc/MetJ family transcription regulator [Nocardiopsis aegyptia]